MPACNKGQYLYGSKQNERDPNFIYLHGSSSQEEEWNVKGLITLTWIIYLLASIHLITIPGQEGKEIEN